MTDPTRPGTDSRTEQRAAADAAELERLRARLAEAEQRFRDLLEGSVQGVMVHRDNRLLFVNAAFAEIFGYPDAAAALAARDWQRFQAPHEVERMEGYRRARLRGEPAPSRYIFEGRRRDGSPVWVENVARVIAWEGQPAILSTMLDVTERRRMEEALRQSEERFRIAFENAPVGMALGTPERGWFAVNQARADFWGVPLEELKSSYGQYLAVVQRVSHPEDYAADMAQWRRVLAGEIDAYEMEKRYIRPDGQVRWGHLSVAVSRNPDRSIQYIISHIVDITARLRAENALRLSEERFRVAFEHAPVGMTLINAEGRYIHVNRAFEAFSGISRDVMLGLPGGYEDGILAVTHPDDVEATRAGFRKIFSGELHAFQLEKRFLRPDGEVRWGHTHLAPVRSADGTLDYVITQVVDITPRKCAEEALRESEERFRIAFENAPIGIALGVAGRGWVRVNPAMERFLGRPAEALMGQPDMLALLREISHPEDYEENAALFRRLAAGEVDHYQMEKRYVLPHGEIRWGFLSVAASRGPKGALRYVVTQITDITALKQAEQALREREAALAAAQRLTHLGSWELTDIDPEHPEQSRMHWSDEMFRIFGLEPGGEAPGLETAMSRVVPEDRERVWESALRCLKERVPFSLELRIMRPDGSQRTVRAQGEAEWDKRTGRVTRLRGTMQDITEQKELERKLLQAQKLESLGLLAGGIAHDFNNLLTGILGYASLARQHLAASSPLQEYVTQIETGGRRAAELCQQMLAYAGRGRFNVRVHALNEVVRDTLPLLEVAIPKKVALMLRLAEDLPAVEVDATQIRQIVMNLVTNAADAIGNQEGRIVVTTGTVDADRAYLAQTYLAPDLPEGRYAFLDVSDTGSGMTPEVQKRIFDPFFTTKFAGRGLGLAAVLGIVRAHHGALKVYSEPGKGTTMRLLLPAAGRAAAPAAPPPTTPWQGQGLALVVDDEPAVREVAARLLRELGFDTLSARDGAEAVAIYNREAGRVRLVLLDLTMPQMDGEETFRALRAVNPAVTAVLMSGFTQQESMDRFTGTGLAAFLQKPFSLEALRETLRQVFADGSPAPPSSRVS